MKTKLWLILIIFILCQFSSTVFASSFSPDYRDLIDNHKSVLILIDIDSGRILYANQAAQEFYGYSFDAFLDLTYSNLSKSSVDELHEYFSLGDNESNTFKDIHTTFNGEIRHVEVHLDKYLSDGNFIYNLAIYDNTEFQQLSRLYKIEVFLLIFLLLCLLLWLSLSLVKSKNKNKMIESLKNEADNFNELRKSFIDADDAYIFFKRRKFKICLF